MSDRYWPCPECGTEGGWYEHESYPPRWTFCQECFGLGWRSVAADRYFGRKISVFSIASPLER